MQKESSAYIFLRSLFDGDKESIFWKKIRELEVQYPDYKNDILGNSIKRLQDNFFIYKGKIFTGLVWVCDPGFSAVIKKQVEVIFIETLKL